MPPKKRASAPARHWLLTRHDQPLLYIPNLIGEWCIGESGKGRERPDEGDETHFTFVARVSSSPLPPPPPPSGYARIAFAAYAFSVASTSPAHTIAAYWAAFTCDELDGRAARALGQASALGAVLDMVTDRLATACLLALLCARGPPAGVPGWLALLALDIASHWFQAAASAAAGAASHKDTASTSSVVRFYYKHRLFMGACCISCEVLYLCLYALTWGPGAWGPAMLPGSSVGSGVVGGALARAAGWVGGVEPGGSGAWGLGRRGALPGSSPSVVPLAAALAAAALPGAAIKQFVNCVQLRTAVGVLAGMDRGAPHPAAAPTVAGANGAGGARRSPTRRRW